VLGVEEWLAGLPPLLIYAVVGAIILLESMGIPLPGEITLVSASLLAAAGTVNVWAVAAAAAAGAIVGDSIGYTIGRSGGRPLLERLGRRFPRHLGPAHLVRAERVLARWGVWAVFFGRFVALLRILAGPLAGALRVPYRKFLLANATGGIAWAYLTSLVIYNAGRAAERYLKDFSWVALAVAVAFGVTTTMLLRRRAARAHALIDDGDPTTNPTPLDEVVTVAVDTAAAATDAIVDAAAPLTQPIPSPSPAADAAIPDAYASGGGMAGDATLVRDAALAGDATLTAEAKAELG
jgi:membrane protein DedA with SNARE-associated domain